MGALGAQVEERRWHEETEKKRHEAFGEKNCISIAIIIDTPVDILYAWKASFLAVLSHKKIIMSCMKLLC